MPSQRSSGTGSARLAVVGADGFIGSHLVREALRQGIGVRAVCVKAAWRLDDVELSDVVFAPDARWWELDYERSLDGAEAVAILAYTPPPEREHGAWLRHEIEVNVAGTRRILDAAAKAGTRVVFASSAQVYGPWHAGAVAEDAQLDPETPYATAKIDAEDACADAGGTALRLATVFGPGEDGPRALPSFIRAYVRGEPPTVHGDGSDVNDYVHVRDVARALLLAGLDPAPPRVNIGSGVGRSTAEVLESVAAVFGQPAAMNNVASPRAPVRRILNVGLARSALGFEPRETFDAAVAEEVAWLRARYAVA